MTDWKAPEKFIPKDYQRDAIKHILSTPGCGLFLKPGRGKTSSTLAAWKILRDKGHGKAVLIVAPLRVVKYTWPAEVSKWEDFEDFSVTILHGPKKDELFAESKTDIYLINFEGLLWLLPKLAKLKPSAWPFDMLVVDESTKLKAYDSKRFKMLKKLLPGFKRRVILTGTPTPQSKMDLFAQAYIMDCGKALTPFITHFRNLYFFIDTTHLKPGEPPPVWGYQLKPGADQLINEKIKHLVYTSDGPAYEPGQEPIFNDIYVELPKEARKQYRDMERLLFSQLEAGIILAANAAVASGKCLSEGTEVLTDQGWVCIEDLNKSFKVWDGIRWVNIDGLQYNGYKQVVSCWGVMMTPDHKILTTSGWATAKEILDGEPYKRYDRPSIRLPYSYRFGVHAKTLRDFCASSMVCAVSMWQYHRNTRRESEAQKARENSVLWLQTWRNTGGCTASAWHVWQKLLGILGSGQRALYKSIKQRLGELRWSRHYLLRAVVAIRKLLERHGVNIQGWFNIGSNRRKWAVLGGELSMGYYQAASQKQAYKHYAGNATRPYDNSRSFGDVQGRVPNTVQATEMWLGDIPGVDSSDKVKVFDVLNAGPLARFTVRNKAGECLLVHNCRQIANGHLYTDDEANYEVIHDEKLEAVDELLEQLVGECVLIWYEYKSDLARLLERFPGEVLTAKSPPDIIERWNAKQIPILYVHWQSAAHGLNMQYGGNTMIYFTTPWSGEGFTQGVARLARQGQTEQVIVHRIVARRTVDELVIKAQALRDASQNDFLEALRAYWHDNKQQA